MNNTEREQQAIIQRELEIELDSMTVGMLEGFFFDCE